MPVRALRAAMKSILTRLLSPRGAHDRSEAHALLHAAVDIEIGRNVVCLLLFLQEAADRSALKTARTVFHGFFTNNSTREWHINSSKHVFPVESISRDLVSIVFFSNRCIQKSKEIYRVL